MKYIKFILLGTVLGLSACATNYYTYSGSPVLVGHGGASRKVGGVDLWVMGTPPWKYRVVGYIEDSRPGRPYSHGDARQTVSRQSKGPRRMALF
jgi:hypothetical protein